LSVLGVAAPPALQGRDLSAAWQGGGLAERPARVDGLFGGLPTIKWRYPSAITMRVDGVRYSYVGLVHEETTDEGGRRFFMYRQGALFDLDADPGQTIDLAPERPELAARLRHALLDWYAENERVARRLELESRAAGRDPTMAAPSEEEAARLRALGYVE
jgi:hypothetical protein